MIYVVGFCLVNLITPSQYISVGETQQKIETISEHFKSIFLKLSENDIPQITPKPLEQPFTTLEIKKAVNKLKNNKSPGYDKITSEHIKYAPCTFPLIAKILNDTVKSGENLEPLNLGLLTPLQKPGKEKGPSEYSRPVILLSSLRKILAICLIDRIQDKINTILPKTQAAYSHGRSGSELVFSFKILAEKAITSQNYEINLLLLDMSKAFDTIKRETLFNDLKSVLNYDELQIVRILLQDVKYSIKLENQTGDPFLTNIGSPQGDGISALFFIIYLAISLSKYNKNTEQASWSDDHTYSNRVEHKILPAGLEDHNYYVLNPNQQFTLDQQYADDIGWASTQSSIIRHIETEIPSLLNDRNLNINASKTEKYTVSRNSTDDWQNCKYIGSLLGTEADIERRKQLTNFAYHKLKSVFKSKHITESTKLRVFTELIESIFLYNFGEQPNALMTQ